MGLMLSNLRELSTLNSEKNEERTRDIPQERSQPASSQTDTEKQ